MSATTIGRCLGMVLGVLVAGPEWRPAAQTPATPPASRWAVPEYRYDPDWPKPLPEARDEAGVSRPQWTGGVGWVCVDPLTDHIVAFNRAHTEPMPAGTNAVNAPPVIIRDYAGNVVRTFGDPRLTPGDSPTGGDIHIIDHETGAILAEVSGPGREPGRIIVGHGISVDSKENLYVSETTPGNRLQRFLRVTK